MRLCTKCGSMLDVITTRVYQDETYRMNMCHSCGEVSYSVEFDIEDNEIFRECWTKAERVERRIKNATSGH